ncbi:acyl-CoA dehydrogenase family protein [Amycolatopsis sp. WQ 127309]|uniref:acyl-CoA dehydrogenase family protein n=1 Tax=Amycolatopsis sp. WQ 127309 TaxID=2932773 RepID=UPI001FF6E1DB|nr:acyl-CoA dehydrogenase family protein [Amycolatopsis sp. WQ 127309]UOZ04249.1 acyl-CoA dehydrogenase family protein [Amycolatopsis sp. WQ 127309]
MSEDPLAGAAAELTALVADRAAGWDVEGLLPVDMLRGLGARGLLCAEVPADFGGLGAGSLHSGHFTAHAGALCSSLRSVMTSQGMAAWTIQRFGDRAQRARYLGRLTSGDLAAVAFSEPAAGSDLSSVATTVRTDGDDIVISGEKVWITAAAYADLLVVVGELDGLGAAVVVPARAEGVSIDRIPYPSGCRAAGHSTVRLDNVRLPRSALLGGGGVDLSMLVTTALAYGRISVAWGCVGILRACLTAAGDHAGKRHQGGIPLADRQLVARHLADLFADEQAATRVCEHASRAWDQRSPEMVVSTVLAKYVSSTSAARGAAAAVQVLASAAAQDGHVVARAHRDAKLMELIEGSNEICQLILAGHTRVLANSGG